MHYNIILQQFLPINVDSEFIVKLQGGVLKYSCVLMHNYNT